jgi:serine/threonine-protein kinase
MPMGEALAFVAQIADGLEAAHESGIVHRDLKPGNIKITPAGQPKILDFGLAKALDPPRAEEGPARSASITGHYTSPGTVFGTVPYMSPEQARGRPVDKRSDIWALGCVLYECLCGRRAFAGDTATDVVAKILERDPDWSALPRLTPPRVRELLARCLEKDPRRRMRDAGDVRIELERVGVAPSRRVVPWAIAAVAVFGALVWAATAGRGRAPEPGSSGSAAPAVPLHVVMSDPDIPRAPYQESPTVAVSPDGLTIAYIGKGPEDVGDHLGLYVRRADGIHAQRIEIPCGDRPCVSDPFFSPDGKSLGFSCGNLYRVSLSGGAPVLLVESAVPWKGATWSSSGIILSPAAKSGLVLVSESGGPLETLTVPDASKDEVSHRWPSALPDGRHVLFTIKKEGMVTFDQGEIAVLDLETRTYTVLFRGGTFARYSSKGQIVFARGSSLLAVAYHPGSDRVEGAPVPFREGVTIEPGSGAAQFALARDSEMFVFVPGGANIERKDLVWIDRSGIVTPTGAPSQHYHTTLLSPDGTRLASTIFGATDGVGIYDIGRRSVSRLPTEGNSAPLAWSPDGRQILYGSDRDGVALMLGNADGSGTPRRLDVDVTFVQSSTLLAQLPEGLGLVYAANGGLWASPLSGNSKPQRLSGDLLAGAATLALSPDGRWLAYDSDVSGRREIYVKPFPTGAGTVQLTHGGGENPRWSSRGDEVLFHRVSGDERWIAALRLSVAGQRNAPSAPVDLFKVPEDLLVWGLHPDGKRLIAVRSTRSPFKGDRVEAVLSGR